MDSQAIALRPWQHVTLGLALELAVGSAYLLFIALLGRRWRRDMLIALPPIVAFAWMMLVSASLRAQAIFWSSYMRFVGAHYPMLTAQTKDDYAHAVASATRLGWIAIVVTECVVILSLLLLRRILLQRHDAAPVVTMPQALDDAGNELEIVVEPLSVESGDVSGV